MRRAFRGKFSVRKRNFFPLFFWSIISSFITFPFRPGSIPFFRNSSFHYITPSCDSQSYPSPLNPFHMFTFYHSLSLYPSSLYLKGRYFCEKKFSRRKFSRNLISRTLKSLIREIKFREIAKFFLLFHWDFSF